MTQSEAVVAAQSRANKTGRRMVVYQIYGSGRDWNNFHVTTDREDLPDDYVVYGVIAPALPVI